MIFFGPIISFCVQKGCTGQFCGSLAIFKPYALSAPGNLLTKVNLDVAWSSQRWKSKGSKRNQDDGDESGDSDDEESTLKGKGLEVKTSVVGSMRADLLLKIGLGIARNKVEEAFYESRIRVNSKKILKKSAQIRVGDEVDLVKGVSSANPNFITVGRIEILAARPRGEVEGIDVKMRRSKALVIENYPDGDPWKLTESAGS